MLDEQQSEISYNAVVSSARSAELRTLLESANVLILPRPGHATYDKPVFAPHTADFARYLMSRAATDISVEVASTDEDYRELGLHADIWYLPIVLVADAAIGPIVVNLVSSFIYDQMKRLLPGKKAEVQSELLIDRDSGTLSLTYTGPAETYESVMKEALRRNGIGRD